MNDATNDATNDASNDVSNDASKHASKHASNDASSYEPKIVDKPWGREIWYAHTERYAGKILEVDAGHLLSLQKHVVKHETLYLLSGLMRFTRDGEVFEWRPGTAVEIPPETVHRMEALEDSVILEVSTPELDDVVRLEDRYGRTGG